MKFNLDDTVTSKKLGLPMIGKIVGINRAELACPEKQHPIWDEVYPDWADKPVCYVRFNKPQRRVSLQEFIEANPGIMENPEIGGDPNILDMVYQNNVPVEKGTVYPEDDLERCE